MQTVTMGGMAPLRVGGACLHPGMPGWDHVVLSKRERATLRRAAEILAELRRRIDPTGSGDWTHDYMVAACAESWVDEAASTTSFEVTTSL